MGASKYGLLDQYLDYTVRSYQGDGNPHNDWKIWTISGLWSKYGEAKDNVKAWMYTTDQLRARHEQ